MKKQPAVRKYGKQHTKPKQSRLFAELPQTPVRSANTNSRGELEVSLNDDMMDEVAGKLSSVTLQDENTPPPDVVEPVKRRRGRPSAAKSSLNEPAIDEVTAKLSVVNLQDENTPPPNAVEPVKRRRGRPSAAKSRLNEPAIDEVTGKLSAVNLQDKTASPPDTVEPVKKRRGRPSAAKSSLKEPPKCQTPRPPTPPVSIKSDTPSEPLASGQELSVLTWSEVCPLGDRIVKIAEASYAEVYRVTNERGTSIIKVIRMESPIKPKTKAQEKSGLVDEEPHSEADLLGELKISEWLADIPGFVVYKERYIVQGKACRELLETHQAFHKKLKRQDPGRLQFYPSPSRYLDGTKFLVVELGDAGIALEDFELTTTDQLWDIFFHVTIALARAETHIEFEHRDLHEGNLCVRRTGDPIPAAERTRSAHFGHSGLEITILDYGLSRACDDYENDDSVPVAYDLERDLSIFTSEHAAQCEVYRQMRSFLLRGDRICLPPKSHRTPYAQGIDGPIDWRVHEPYTNVLWLAYIYQYMLDNFRGPKKELNTFKRLTKELWLYLNPKAGNNMPGFESASDIVRFAVESGWVEEDQLMGGREEVERSILSILSIDEPNGDGTFLSDMALRRSPRRRSQRIA